MKPAAVYVMPLRAGARAARLFAPIESTSTGATLFKSLPSDFSFSGYRRVATVAEADFVALPEAVTSITSPERVAIEDARRLAEGKPVLVFLSGDYAHKVHIDESDVMVCTATTYTQSRRKNEIVFAPFVEDLGQVVTPTFQVKGERPMVSFCGYAGLSGWKSKIKYHAMNVLRSLVGDEVHKRGIYFRKKAMEALSRDARISTNFIVRNSFSGNLTTASKDAETLRKEYVDSILESDFVLCPKGDANYSSRFYETLSLGRIPILIDTDMVLPLSHIVDYDSFIIRVPYRETHRVGDYLMERWNALSDSQFKAMQERARLAFSTYLRYDAYFNTALPLLAEKGIEAVL